MRNLGENISKTITNWTGSSTAFLIATVSIIIWGILGPYYNFSDTWQLIANTGTTIVTFLMVFLIQRTQNKDSLAIQLKLNELIASSQSSSNRLLNIENLTEKEIELLRKRYINLATRTNAEEDKTSRHTIEEIDDD